MAMKASSRGVSLLGLATSCLLFLVSPTHAGSRSRGGNNLQSSSSMKSGGLEEFYFSQVMTEDDEHVVLLEEGPFKLTASCQTITYNYSDWNEIYYYSSQYYSTYSSSAFLGLNSSTASQRTSSSHSSSLDSSSTIYSYSYDDDWSWSDDYWYDGTHTESIAALELTYTATDSDYLFGSPSWLNYPHQDRVVGSYEAGESRTQIVFAGYDGGWSQDCTLQSLSGSYITTNSGSTIGTHRSQTSWYPYASNSFPDDVDCMIAGVISYSTS